MICRTQYAAFRVLYEYNYNLQRTEYFLLAAVTKDHFLLRVSYVYLVFTPHFSAQKDTTIVYPSCFL